MGSAADLVAPGIRLVLKEGWHGQTSESNGAFVIHLGTDMTVHVRGWRAVDPRTELMTQNWGVPPHDIVERTDGSRRTVAGTFATSDGRLVREWFVIDGGRGANASVWFERVPYDLTPLERLVDSIELR
jgi:hypothetical protein